MIKPQELRLGNIVEINNAAFLPEATGKTGSVVRIEERKDKNFPNSTGTVAIKLGVHEYSQFNEFVKPVPITEDWLLKFGFENTGAALIKQTGNGGSIDWDGGSFYVNMILHENLKFVHQLQNLFYSLTGEELTTKETP